MADMADVLKQLQETATVMAGIQARHAARMEEHEEWLQAHDQAIIEARERDKRIDQRIEDLVSTGKRIDERIERLVIANGERGKQIDERIEKLVIAIGKLVASKS